VELVPLLCVLGQAMLLATRALALRRGLLQPPVATVVSRLYNEFSLVASFARPLPTALAQPLQRRRWLSAKSDIPPGARKGAAALSLTELRLVTREGSVGVMKPEEALKIAKERQMELIEVSSKASPPVWRLMPPPEEIEDDVEAAEEPVEQPTPTAGEPPLLIRRPPRPGKPPKPLKVKEVRLTDKIEPRDVETKADYALRFLTKGHVVKVIALNTGLECQTTQRPKAQTLVELICLRCDEIATSSGATAGGGQGGRMQRDTIGVVSATLTPKSKLEGNKGSTRKG
jgi:translation initiation factor IF-3